MMKLEIAARVILALIAIGCGILTTHTSGIMQWEGAVVTFCFSYLAVVDLHHSIRG